MLRKILVILVALAAFGPAASAAVHEVRFESGGVSLRALLHTHDGEKSRALAVYLHGNPGSPLDEESKIADVLTAAGVDVLRFNYRGLWGNGGGFNLTNAIGDLRAALDFLTTPETAGRYGLNTSRIFLVGYSFGTATALVGARGDERVTGIVSFAPCDHGFFAREWMDPDSEIRDFLDSTVEALFGEGGPVKQDASVFIDDLSVNARAFSWPEHAATLLDKKLLFIAGLDDRVCFVEDHFIPLYRELQALDHPALDARVLNMDHGFNGVGIDQMLALTVDWIERVLAME